MSNLAESMARRAAERSVAERQASYVREIERIVDATHRVMATSGSFDPPLRDILGESGLSTQAFYKHFRSKDELLLLMLDDGRRQLVSYLEHRMDKAGTPAGRIKAWIEGGSAFLISFDPILTGLARKGNVGGVWQMGIGEGEWRWGRRWVTGHGQGQRRRSWTSRGGCSSPASSTRTATWSPTG